MLGYFSFTVIADRYSRVLALACDEAAAAMERDSSAGGHVARYSLAMGTDTASLLQQALALPEGEREMLAAELLASIDGPDIEHSPERAAEWAREIERRIERFAKGDSQGVDLDAARQRVSAALSDG